MIPVKRTLAPSDFNAKIGKVPKSFPLPPVSEKFWLGKKHWRKVLSDLYHSYDRTCAFAAVRIERVTGFRSVEHFKPKGKYPALAYDWDNFRLVCGLMNGRKGDHEDVLDPFDIPENIFTLDLVSGDILVSPQCPEKIRKRAELTIARLRLGDPECCAMRSEHISKIFNNDWSYEEAKSMSPFVVASLEQQGLL